MRQHLTALYALWCQQQQNLPAVSADEQTPATPEQAAWLAAFITLLDATP